MIEFEIGISLHQEMLLSIQKDRSRWLLHSCYREDGFPVIFLNSDCCWGEGVVTLPWEQYVEIQNKIALPSSLVCSVEAVPLDKPANPRGHGNTVSFSEGRYGYAKCTLSGRLKTASATQYYGRG